MGEYLEVPGSGRIKMGTLDDFRYVRREECERWARRGIKGPDDPADALRDPSTLWRFRFPWEDADTVADIHKRGMTDSHRFTFNVPGLEIDHRAHVVSMGAPAGAYNVNVWVPCPYTLPRNRLPMGEDVRGACLCSALPSDQVVYLVGERYDEQGRGRTVFGCIYCQRWVALTPDDLGKLREANHVRDTQDARHKSTEQVLERLMPAWVAEAVTA